MKKKMKTKRRVIAVLITQLERIRTMKGLFTVSVFLMIIASLALFVSSVARSTVAQGTGTTTRVSVASDGTQGNSYSDRPSISADGRYVAFNSAASNLVPGDTNDASDIFVYDRQTKQTIRAVTSGWSVQWGYNCCRYPLLVVSADGRYVAFDSWSSNLVPGDTNDCPDIFVYDQLTGITERVSIAFDETEGNDFSHSPSISADGRYVAFWSKANNLVPSDTNYYSDVFVHDRATGQTTRVSMASDGAQGNFVSYCPSISADGRYVAFISRASNLVPGGTVPRSNIFVHDRVTGQTTHVSVASDGTEGNSLSYDPSISADGRFVVFESWATNLVVNDTNGSPDIFIHDRQTGQTTRVSVASDGTQGNHESGWPSISADGRYVAFDSHASNLVPDDTSSTSDIFVHDRGGGPEPTPTPSPTPTPTPNPTPTPTPAPVILLPGMTASAKWRCFLFEAGCDVQEGWHWMPTAQRYYQPLIDQLNAAGYTEENHYLQVFFYDWRRPIAENVAKLKAKIDEVKAVTGATEVDLVGHSMGGLVGRAYIQSIVYEDDVANLITLGSPHEGAAKAYPYWEGAFLYRMLPYESIAYPILIHYYTRRLGPNPVYAIRSKIPSIQDLLPTADYLYDEVRGDQVKPEMTMVHRNTYLPGLNADAGTLFARTGVNTFVGQSISTPVRFFVHDYSGWPYWEDGEPNWNREPEFLSDQGDGTVSATSAKLPSPAQVQEFPGVNHGALPGSKEAIDAIFSILGIPIPPSTQVKSLEYLGQEIIILALDGPVDGTITDPLGQSVGPGGVTIPGAEYVSDPDDPFKLIMIPNPEEGGFKINLTGSGSGSYELGLLDTFGFDTVITDTTTLWDAPSSQIEPGVAVSFALTYTLQISPTTRLIAETPVIEIPVWAGEIEVEGRALPGNTVEVRDADTEVLLGSAAADMSGHFSVLLSAPLYAEQKIYPKANGVAGVPVIVQKRPFTIYLPLILRNR